MEDKTIQIRNSTVDFLVFTKDAGEEGIEVRVQAGNVWLTQKAIAQLFDVERSVVTKHIKNIYGSGELEESLTCANFAQVADNGKTYQYKFILYQQLLLWVTGQMVKGRCNLGNGRQKYWIRLQNKVMY